MGTSRIRTVRRIAEHDDLCMQRVRRQFKQADGAESRLFVVGQDGTAGVHQDHPVAVTDALEVRVSGDHDIDRSVEVLVMNGIKGSCLRYEAVPHTDSPALDLKVLDRRQAWISKVVVVSQRGYDRRELFQPVENTGRGNVARVENHVHQLKESSAFRSQFVEVPVERGKVCVGDKAEAHVGLPESAIAAWRNRKIYKDAGFARVLVTVA